MSLTLIARRELYGDKNFIASGKPIGVTPSGIAQKKPDPIKVIHANNYACNVTSVAKVAAPGNKFRKRLFIQNRGTQNIFVQFGALPSGSPAFASAISIPPGGFREWEYNCPVDDLYAIVALGVLDQLLSIEEGIEHNEFA